MTTESVCEGATLGRTHYDRAKLYASQGDVDSAILAYEAAIAYAPAFAEAHSNLGNLYLQRGRRDDALRAFETAICAKPDLAPLYCNLAAAQIDLGCYDNAISALETALRLAPNFPEAHANLCQAYRRSGRDREALAPAMRATQLRPNRDAFLDLGEAAFSLEAYDIALDAYRRALALDATCAKTHCNLGVVYHATGRDDEAIAAGERAIALRPDFAVAHRNIATVYHRTGRYAEAIAACEAAIDLQPGFVSAHFNLAFSLLVCGDFARGWDEYIWTWRVPEWRARHPHLGCLPLWDGAAFADRQLLIIADEGLGDAIQFVRYLPTVKARGGRVILEVTEPLVALFADLQGVDELRVHTSAASDVDLHIPLSGLPRAFATDLTSIPAPIPYLRPQSERVDRWRPRLATAGCLRVGIVWAGNPNHANDWRRSARLDDFAVLGEIEAIAWFGLQKGRDEARRSCGRLALDPLGTEIGDFADTAAIIAQLDLVIGVDTAVVHLAGALGTPVWTLLPFAADWRWLLERGDSPWYPTMRLFRQPASGDWASVFAQIARELRTFQKPCRT